jgi:hypothetical protein
MIETGCSSSLLLLVIEAEVAARLRGDRHGEVYEAVHAEIVAGVDELFDGPARHFEGTDGDPDFGAHDAHIEQLGRGDQPQGVAALVRLQLSDGHALPFVLLELRLSALLLIVLVADIVFEDGDEIPAALGQLVLAERLPAEGQGQQLPGQPRARGVAGGQTVGQCGLHGFLVLEDGEFLAQVAD